MDLTAWETQTPRKALGGIVLGKTAPEWGAGSTGLQNGRQMPQDGQGELPCVAGRRCVRVSASKAPLFLATVASCVSGPGSLSGWGPKASWPQGLQHILSCVGSSSDQKLCLGIWAPGAQQDDTPCHPQVLFTEVAYAECQAYFWHQSQMGGLELLAPTIHRIIRQCGDTANLVTSSCLGAPSMTSRDRARVVKFWIQVAKVCHWTANGVHPGILGTAPLLCQPS